MKVSVILMQFPTPRETFASNDINSLSEHGVELSIYCLRPKHKNINNLIKERDHKELSINHNSISKLFVGFLHCIFMPKNFIKLILFIIQNANKFEHLVKSICFIPRVLEIANLIRKDKPDIVHLYWSHYPSLVGYLIKELMPEIKVTMSFIAYDLAMRYGPSIKFALIADAVFTIAKIDINTILEFGVPENKLSVVYHGIKSEYLNIDVPSKKRFRIITAGALIEDKKIDDVIKTFERVKRVIKEASLVILGDGPKKDYLENMVKQRKIDNITFLGHVSHNNVFDEMKKAEVFLFISQHNERLPNVVKEAMACYCYCVVSDTEGIDELITDGVSGSIVQKGDIEAASRNTINILSNKRKMKNAIKDAHGTLSKNFDVFKTMNIFIENWKNLLLPY